MSKQSTLCLDEEKKLGGIKSLPLSVAVITLNEQGKLPRCLESIRHLAAEIIVVDSGSVDGTREVAAQFHARFEFCPWRGHVAQKNLALSRCTQPWVLCLDADEVLSPELANNIQALFALGDPPQNGFFVNRFNYYLGAWIRHAWYPEWRLRLVRRTTARWDGLDPHDELAVTGNTGRLPGHLLHFPFDSMQEHFETELRYAKISANSYFHAGRSFAWYRLLLSPVAVFLKIILFKSGWLDGWRGWVIAGVRGANTFIKYAYLLEGRFNKQRGQ